MAKPKTLKPLSLLAWKLLQAMAKPYGHLPHVYPSSYPALHTDHDGRFVMLLQTDLNRDAGKAALELIASDWIGVDTYNNHRLNEAGLQAAATTPRPKWSPPPPPPMNDDVWDVLNAMNYAQRESSYPQRWVRSLDVGGSNGSHHSASLLTLVRHGYAESAQRGSSTIDTAETVMPEPILGMRAKGSRMYRITDAGVDAVKAYHAAQKAQRAPEKTTELS